MDSTPIINPIEEEARREWALLKWTYMERVQEEEPHLWLGWYDLVTVASIGPEGEMYVAGYDSTGVREDH